MEIIGGLPESSMLLQKHGHQVALVYPIRLCNPNNSDEVKTRTYLANSSIEPGKRNRANMLATVWPNTTTSNGKTYCKVTWCALKDMRRGTELVWKYTWIS